MPYHSRVECRHKTLHLNEEESLAENLSANGSQKSADSILANKENYLVRHIHKTDVFPSTVKSNIAIVMVMKYKSGDRTRLSH